MSLEVILCVKFRLSVFADKVRLLSYCSVNRGYVIVIPLCDCSSSVLFSSLTGLVAQKSLVTFITDEKINNKTSNYDTETHTTHGNSGVVRHGARAPWSLRMHANFVAVQTLSLIHI